MVDTTPIYVMCSDGILVKVEREIAEYFVAFKEVFEEAQDVDVTFREVASPVLLKII